MKVCLKGGTIEGHRVVDTLGRGAFGCVYLCENTAGHTVAMKISQGEDFVTSLQREHEVLGLVENPHVIKTLGISFRGEGDKRQGVMITEVGGINLYQYQQKVGKFKSPETRVFTRQVASALEQIHRLGIIHCDLKLENIVVKTCQEGLHFRLIDFGLSRLVTDADAMSNTYIVSRWYRAPELLFNKRATPSIDIWSFFCIIMELCTGTPLFMTSYFGDVSENVKRNVMTIYQIIIILKTLGFPICGIKYAPIPSELEEGVDPNIVKLVNLGLHNVPLETYYKDDYAPIILKIGQEIIKYRSKFSEPECLINRLLTYFDGSFDPSFAHLICYMCQLHPGHRITAADICSHPFVA